MHFREFTKKYMEQMMKGKNKRKDKSKEGLFYYMLFFLCKRRKNYKIYKFSNIFHHISFFFIFSTVNQNFSLFLKISFIQTEASCCIVERFFGSKHVNILFIQISKYFFLNSFFFFIVSVITFIIHIATNLTVSCLESDTNNYKQKR